MRVTIVCMEGGLAGERFTFAKDRIAIGRDPDGDVPLHATEDDEASWHHAEIRIEGGRVRIVDLNSTNGTYRNGDPVKDAALDSGDRIRFGPTGPLLEVRFGSRLRRLWRAIFGRSRPNGAL